MRLPHYLVCSPSGTWHFRQRVPADLHAVLGTTCFKHSLRTRDPLLAQRLALDMAERYAQAIRQARGMHVSNSRDGKPSVDEVLHAATAGKRYRLIRHADGSVEIEANGQADHDRAMNAVERIGPLMDEPYIRRIMAEAAARTATPVAAPAPASKIPTYPIGKVVAQWLADIKPNTLRKTLTIKAAAVLAIISSVALLTLIRQDSPPTYCQINIATPVMASTKNIAPTKNSSAPGTRLESWQLQSRTVIQITPCPEMKKP